MLTQSILYDFLFFRDTWFKYDDAFYHVTPIKKAAWSERMAYTPTYDSTDLSAITIDGIASVFAVIVSLATLVGLVLLYNWMKKRV